MTSRRDQLHDQCAAFHKAHPEVWAMFERFTLERISRGFQHYSARAIWHRIRWEMAKPDYQPGEEFKLNNNHTPFYARRFHRLHPKHADFFHTRRQISDDDDAVGLPALGPDDFPPAPPKPPCPHTEVHGRPALGTVKCAACGMIAPLTDPIDWSKGYM